MQWIWLNSEIEDTLVRHREDIKSRIDKVTYYKTIDNLTLMVNKINNTLPDLTLDRDFKDDKETNFLARKKFEKFIEDSYVKVEIDEKIESLK